MIINDVELSHNFSRSFLVLPRCPCKTSLCTRSGGKKTRSGMIDGRTHSWTADWWSCCWGNRKVDAWRRATPRSAWSSWSCQVVGRFVRHSWTKRPSSACDEAVGQRPRSPPCSSRYRTRFHSAGPDRVAAKAPFASSCRPSSCRSKSTCERIVVHLQV